MLPVYASSSGIGGIRFQHGTPSPSKPRNVWHGDPTGRLSNTSARHLWWISFSVAQVYLHNIAMLSSLSSPIVDQTPHRTHEFSLESMHITVAELEVEARA